RHRRRGPRRRRQGAAVDARRPERSEDGIRLRRLRHGADVPGARARDAADHAVTVSVWEPEVTTDRLPEAGSDDFVDLFTSQYPKLVGALRVAGAVDKAAAEDLAQEAFARTLGHWRRPPGHQPGGLRLPSRLPPPASPRRPAPDGPRRRRRAGDRGYHDRGRRRRQR